MADLPTSKSTRCSRDKPMANYETSISARAAAKAEFELTKLYNDTGIDLSMLPTVMTAEELAPVIRTTVGALATDRYRKRGIPFVHYGRRVRYLKVDVARYLAANRSAGVPDTPPGVSSYPKPAAT
jgi:hypothetical protein